MNVALLNRDTLYHSFLNGAKEVIQQKKILNELNVFPVPDGDTGSNLSSMMYTILEEAKVGNTTKETLQSIADAALIGARGNSGIIFAQYISGMLETFPNEEEITLEDFVTIAEGGVAYAYQAISNPVEGTMITVMKDWALALKSLKGQTKDFVEAFVHAFEAAKSSLLATTEKLKALKDANVVDAGAKGFVHFIEGILNFLRTGKSAEIITSHETVEELSLDHTEADITYRYCTEALVSGSNIDIELLRKELSTFGDSLVLAGNSSKFRLHIHTNEPQDFFHSLRKYGTILQQKADDMKMQHEAAHNRKYDIAIVTDSIADLPQEIIDSYQVYMVPMNILIDGVNYYDKLTVSSKNFYNILEDVEHYPTSAQPNQKHLENFYSFLSTYYRNIITITVSSKMSGTYQAFEAAANKYRNETTQIAVIDSKQNSAAQGLIVMRAAEMVDAGLSFKDVVNQLHKIIEQSTILVSVKTLKYMVRSGRVSKVTGLIAKLLNLKPVISIDRDGNGIILEKALSIKKNTQIIIDTFMKTYKEKGIERYSIIHANDEKRAKELEEKIMALTNTEASYITDISPIVAMSAGVGAIAMAYITKE